MRVLTFLLLSVSIGFWNLGTAFAVETTRVCRGEHDSRCESYRAQFSWTERETCGIDTRSSETCNRYCGKPEGPGSCSISVFKSESGNRCGYSLFTVRCFP
jgi:hypothetical protein